MRKRWISSLHLVKPCWICLLPSSPAIAMHLDVALRRLGFAPLDDSAQCYALKAEDDWSLLWPDTAACISEAEMDEEIGVGIVAGEEPPTLEEAELHRQTVRETNAVAEQMWLITAIESNRLTCHFLPVIDSRGSVFGYESLVRAIREDGSIANGGTIFQAGRLLRIEHLIDRHLHELAVRHYVGQKRSGFLFINLVPGFIQRPEFYFGGLRETVRQHGMNGKQIVLDCTNSENPRDIQQLKGIARYCRSQGYLLSMDDVESIEGAKRVLQELHPDFIKLDMRLVQRLPDTEALRIIKDIASMIRRSPCALIAEGVETESTRGALLEAGIGLFQGHLFASSQEEKEIVSALRKEG